MSMKFENIWQAQTNSHALDFVEDGKYIYVLCQSAIEVYSWWGNDISGIELLPWDQQENLNKDTTVPKLKLEKTYTVSGFKWLQLGNKCLWLLSDTTIKKVDFDVVEILKDPTDIWSTNLTLPEGRKHLCTPLYYDNQIWLLMEHETTATEVKENTGFYQNIYIYNTLTKVLGIHPFSTTMQFTRAEIACGYNGYVYITNWSDFAVLKYNYDGSIQSKITVNANPYKIVVDPNTRRLYVVSNSELVSYIDPDTDLVTHSQGSAIGVITSISFFDSENYWYTGENKFGNVNIPTSYHNFTEGTADYNYDVSDLPDKAFHKLQLTRPFNLSVFDGTNINAVLMEPHLIVIALNHVYVIKLSTTIMPTPKSNSITVIGHTMMIGGYANYQGEYL